MKSLFYNVIQSKLKYKKFDNKKLIEIAKVYSPSTTAESTLNYYIECDLIIPDESYIVSVLSVNIYENKLFLNICEYSLIYKEFINIKKGIFDYYNIKDINLNGKNCNDVIYYLSYILKDIERI